MSSLPTPGQNRLNFKSKCSFSFQRECFRCSHSRQRYDWQLLLALWHAPWQVVPGTAALLRTGPVLHLGSDLPISASVVGLKRASDFSFFTWEWLDDSLDPGTAACCNDHCTFHATEVWSLPSFLCWFCPQWCLDGALLDVEQAAGAKYLPLAHRT